ncbi:MAG TPA: GTP-binding protein [Methanomassiliicoccales archaeon]|nr:GTP-binding protein [Methanomassiliicoccales archaeon]
MPTRIAILGGFLGAGKTTLLTKLAKTFTDKGKTVALITNDQGDVLVDTQYAKELGIETTEVLKGCFCCKFPDFIDGARKLVDAKRPDIIMAEPVGSCTDLLATVVAPLKLRFPSEFDVAPLTVLLDSTRISEGVEEEGSLGAFLRKHQVQEAEVIVLTKTDLISKDDKEALVGVVRDMNPGARVVPYSAVSGEGLAEIASLVLSHEKSVKRPVDVDYELYAQAEAELGWYNGTYTFELPSELDSYDLCSSIMKTIAQSYQPGEVAHVKLLFSSPSNALKMSLVLGGLGVDGVRGSRRVKGKCTLNMNARVVSTPEVLAKVVREAVIGTLKEKGATSIHHKDDCFAPGRPNPTYRYKNGV